MTDKKTNAPERIAFRRKWMTDAITDGPLMDDPEYVQYIRADLAPQWQDIATAPKDGTTIFVISYSDGKWWKPDLAHWDENSGRWENGESYDEWPLTHWHPAGTLPTPPEPTQ